jgi:hypothetical protein
MAFKTQLKTQRQALERAIDVARQQKSILQNISSKLDADITGVDALDFLANFSRVITELNSAKAVPGIAQYARDQFDDQSYDVVAEFNTVIAALTSCDTWLKNNIPSDAVSIVDGALVGNIYTPAQTAVLKNRVETAITTID